MESIRELRQKVAKSGKAHHAPKHDVIVRRLSIYLTWLILHTPLSANSVTVLQIFVGVAGGLCLISPLYGWNIAGILLLQLGYVLDCSDGEVARYRGQSSIRGVFLDLIGHEVVIPFMYMGLALGEFQRSGSIEILFFGFTTALFSLRFDLSAMFQVVNTLFIKADNPSYSFDALQHSPQSSATTKLATEKPSLFRTLFRYPESMNIISIALLLDWLLPVELPYVLNFVSLFLVIYGTLVPLARVYSIFVIFRSGEIEKRYSEIVRTAERMSNKV